MAIAPRSTFSAAADRLDRLVREVKEQQCAATGFTLGPSPSTGEHPEEVWLREFATHAIRRVGEGDAYSGPQRNFPAPSAAGFGRVRLPQDVRRRSDWAAGSHGGVRSGAQGKVVAPDEGGHIGAMLGKPGPKRGFFARLRRSRDK